MADSMDRTKWKQVMALFSALADADLAERERALAAIEDPEVRAEVRALLAADAHTQGRLDQAVVVAEAVRDGLAPSDLEGLTVDGYLYKKCVGRGGMGEVYLATRVDIGGDVAIKVLRPGGDALAFAREQHMHAGLVHPGIPQYHGHGLVPDGRPYFALEFVRGLPITKHCEQQQLRLPARLSMFRATCEAAAYLHGERLVHRDLKPSNILAKADGSVRLLDFGIAKPVDDLGLAATQTWGGGLTPAYAAPEQLAGGRANLRSDVYALGVVLYELLAGQHPFGEPDLAQDELVRRVREDTAARPSAVAQRTGHAKVLGSLGREAWKDLDRLVAKAMAKRPDERYPSVEALGRDVDRFLQGLPLEARPHSLGYRTRKFVRRNRRGVLGVATAAAALAALSIVYVIDLASARDLAQQEADRAARVQDFMRELMTGGDAQVGPRAGLTVEAMLERAAARADVLSRDPALKAEVLAEVGQLIAGLGKFDRASALLRESLALNKAQHGWHSVQVLRVLLALAELRREQGNLALATRDIQYAVDVADRVAPSDVNLRARVTAARAQVLTTQGQYQQVIDAIEAFNRWLGTRSLEPDLAASLREALGIAHFYLGHYHEAETIFRVSLTRDRREFGQHHPHVADDLINLGAVATDRGRLDEAERYNRQAAEILEAYHGENHAQTVSGLTIWARSLVALSRGDEAKRVLERAMTINGRLYGENHPQVASTLNELFLLAYERDDLPGADAHITRALAIERALHGDNHPRVGVALANKASVQLALGRPVEAEQGFRAALAVYARLLPPGHLNVAIAQLKLSRALRAQARLEEATQAVEQAHRVLEGLAEPPAWWVKSTAKELVAVYDATGRSDEAAPYRALAASP